MKMITSTHLKSKHDMTSKQYKKQFPGVKLADTMWLDAWRNSQENKEHACEVLTQISKDVELQKRRKEHISTSWKDEDLRERQSLLMKEVSKTNESFADHLRNKPVTERMKMSNYDRWLVDHGKVEADKRQLNWQAKNIIPTLSKNTRQELQIASMLQSLGIEFITQHSVIRYYCDFYIPKFNTIIEHFGRYHHADPAYYVATDVIIKKGTSAEMIWAHDAKRIDDLMSYGHKVVVIWQDAMTWLTPDMLNSCIAMPNQLIIVHERGDMP